MKSPRRLIVSTIALALEITGVAIAQEKQPAVKPAALALEVTYLKGAAPTFQQLYAPAADGKPRGTWYGRFGRVPGWKPTDASLTVRAVNVVSHLEGDAARVDVSVYVGVEFFDKELPVASYLLREAEKITVEALTSFGVEPIDIAVVKLRLSTASPPPVVNRTSSLEVVAFEAIESTRPLYKLVLRNVSSKNVSAIEIDVFAGNALKLSGQQHGEEGRPLIAPGAVFEKRVIGAEDVLMKRQGYKPKPLPDQSVVVRTAVFDDGSYEGDPEAAAQFAARTVGTRIQLTRAVALLQKALDTLDFGSQEAAAALTREVSALSTDVQPSVIEELSNKFSALDQNKKATFGGTVQYGLHSVRKGLLDSIDEFQKSRKQPADEAELRIWLARQAEKYKQWLSHL